MSAGAWEALMVAVGGLITAIGYWIKQRAARPKLPRRTATGKALAARGEVHNTLKELMARLANTGDDTLYPSRVLLISAHNGGSHPHPSVSLFVTVSAEERRHNVLPLKQDWNQRPVDGAYVVDVLLPLIEKGRVLIIDEKLDEETLLADALATQHAKYAYFWLVGIDDDKGETWYVSAHLEAETLEEINSPKVREHLRWAATELQKTLRLDPFKIPSEG